MNTLELFQAAAEIFHADPRVAAMPYSEHDDMYVYASSHYVEEHAEYTPAGFKSANLSQFGMDGFVAYFPPTTTFLEGPVQIFWNAAGKRTDYFQFDGEEKARTLTAHEAMQYAAHRAAMQQLSERVDAATDALDTEWLRVAKAADVYAKAGQTETEQQCRKHADALGVLSVELHHAKKDQDREWMLELLAKADAMLAKEVAA